MTFGEIVYGEAPFGEPGGSTPQGSLAGSFPVPVVALSGTYTAPVNPAGTFDAVLPVPTVALTGAYHAHETGVLAASLPVPTVAFSGDYTAPPHPVGTFTVVLPDPVVVLAGSYFGPVPTDTSNALDGLDIVFTGTASVTRPPAEAPASLVLGEKYDKAIAYPVPVMVDGRPT